MVLYQEKSKRTYTGAKIHQAHKKRKSRFGSDPIETKIGNSRKKVIRTRGGNVKIKSYTANMIDVTNLKTKKTERVPIKSLFENKASVDFQRRNILTKGAIVETKVGKVRITSRPGQSGTLSGVHLD